MLTQPLPTTLDIRKAAAREVVVKGAVTLAGLERLRGALASDEGFVDAVCSFARDEQSRNLVTVKIEAELSVPCQRCLDSMPIRIQSENRLAIVWSDEQAKQLPSDLEAWVVEVEQGDLWALVEDELMLGLPIVSYHESLECKQILDAYRPLPQDAEEAADNPFKVLELLKSGDK